MRCRPAIGRRRRGSRVRRRRPAARSREYEEIGAMDLEMTGTVTFESGVMSSASAVELSYFAKLLAWSASEIRCQVLSGSNAVMAVAMPAVCGPRFFS